MADFYIGLITTAVVVALLEIPGLLEKKLAGAMTLSGIAFIYIGFSTHDMESLVYCIIAVAFFFGLSYFGYKKNFILVIVGLILHGIWDIAFPYFSNVAPGGYDIFCLTIDFLLAVYFYIRIKPLAASN